MPCRVNLSYRACESRHDRHRKTGTGSEPPSKPVRCAPLVTRIEKGYDMSVWTEESFEVVHQHFHGLDTPAFDSPEMQAHVWGRRWGVTNDWGTLRVVLMH